MPPRRSLLLAVLLLIAALAACAPPAAPEPLPTASPTVDSTPTPTVVWFPPTPTRTPIATLEIVPTPEQRPGVGEILLEDGFDGEGTRWPVSRTSVGAIAYGKDELTLAVSLPKGTLLSLSSEPVLDDFYAEVTTKASLCRGDDMYGLLLRASSDQDFYRLLFNCNGFIRVERAVGGQTTLVQDWTPSGQVPPGSPLVLRVGVWAVDEEMRVFVNDVFQFSVSDPIHGSGRIGLFARSAGDTPLTVSFSDLVVRSVDAESEQPFATPTPEDLSDLTTSP